MTVRPHATSRLNTSLRGDRYLVALAAGVIPGCASILALEHAYICPKVNDAGILGIDCQGPESPAHGPDVGPIVDPSVKASLCGADQHCQQQYGPQSWLQRSRDQSSFGFSS